MAGGDLIPGGAGLLNPRHWPRRPGGTDVRQPLRQMVDIFNKLGFGKPGI
jgi:hypothetical protein